MSSSWNNRQKVVQNTADEHLEQIMILHPKCLLYNSNCDNAVQERLKEPNIKMHFRTLLPIDFIRTQIKLNVKHQFYISIIQSRMMSVRLSVP